MPPHPPSRPTGHTTPVLLPADKRLLLGAGIAVVAVIALALAAAGEGGRATRVGLLVFVLTTLLEFRLIAQHFDIREGKRARLDLLPRAESLIPVAAWDRALAGALAVLASIGGLFLAARTSAASGAYDAGLAIFVAATLYVFALIKAATGARARP